MPETGTATVTKPLDELNKPLLRTLNADLRKIGDDSSREIELSFSSEDPYRRWFYTEILSHAPDAVDLSRLNEVGVVLYSHGYDSRLGRMPIAKIKSCEIDSASKKGRAVVEFDTDEDSEKILNKIKGGFIKGVSVGYRVLEWEELTKKGQTSSDGRFVAAVDDTYIAKRWQPYEISVEPTPADPTVGIGRSLDENINNQNKSKTEGNKTMDEENNGTVVIPTEDNASNDAAVARAIDAERQRVADITALGTRFGVDVNEHIKSGANVDDVRSAVLEALEKRMSPGSVSVTNDEGDKFRTAATEGLMIRAGVGDSSKENSYRNIRLRGLANICLEKTGVKDVNMLSDDEAFRRALTPDSAFIAILDNTVNKSMAKAYSATPTTYQLFTSKGSLTDFKPANIYQISEAGELKKMTQNGEFVHDEMIDTKVTESLATFGRSFSITRQALINDDLSVLSRVPMAYVSASKRGVNKLVYTLLASADVIKTDNKNLGTAGAISVKTLGEMRKLMKTQKNIRGKETLNIEGKHVLAPAALEVNARELIASVANPAGAHSGVANVFHNTFDLICDACLDDFSEKKYYLAADPNEHEGIRVSWLNGQEMPILESKASWSTLGIEYRIYTDVGVTLVDYRAFAGNNGV